jgi:hypothetical protein
MTRGDPKVASQCQLAAAAESRPVDERDGRPAVGLKPFEQAGVDGQQRRVGVAIA